MKPEEKSKFLHDLRAPLARAQTYSKLLAESKIDAELLQKLQEALADLERMIRIAESPNSSR